MREEYKHKISIYGSSKDIITTKTILDKLELTGNEYHDRLVIQDAMDKYNINVSILYDGNHIYSYNKIIRDFKRALNSKPCSINEYGSGDWDMSNALYDFITLACGSIAHFNKYGWIGTYPTKNKLKQFCRKNEFGQDIVRHQPSWASDRIKITTKMLEIIKD